MVLDPRIFPRIALEQNYKNKRNRTKNPHAWKKDNEISDDFRSKFPLKECYSEVKKKQSN